jgi:hypothetical protein
MSLGLRPISDECLKGFFGINVFSPEASPAGLTGRAAFFITLAAVTALPTFMWL